jgi:hypothetical protein
MLSLVDAQKLPTLKLGACIRKVLPDASFLGLYRVQAGEIVRVEGKMKLTAADKTGLREWVSDVDSMLFDDLFRDSSRLTPSP